ncbi:hypothetical protein CKM354_000184800 [Cercospora kikuchii]|uniref:F-box domain-containing protein n=1 Tax=Cercospora kikuchii TaxID=84275 RepID=A0A9P3F8P1_9PEZI|nr:uncharacterized protein CKM354_000184800 [Cercospora kikuchii]GIZ38431.1 hypothetical protein CKM354_000184800 [Cercospora kikuchii]
MASDDRRLVADYERVSLQSSGHNIHATSKHARTVEDNMAAQEQSFPEKSTEDRIGTQTHDSANSFRSSPHVAIDSTLDGKKLAIPVTTMTQKVFETTELLEAILLQLGARDILTAQQVGREWRDAVNGSMKLKTRLGIELDDVDKVPYHSPFKLDPSVKGSDFEPLDYHISREYCPCRDDMSKWEFAEKRFRVCLGFRRREETVKLRVGSRCRAMRLCHPPLKSAMLTIDHYNVPLKGAAYSIINLDRPDGITIGDVLDIIDGAHWEGDSPRNQIREVCLHGCIELSEDDPMVGKGNA